MRSPDKSPSNFTRTCNLLSQYVKEKGTFGDVSLEMTRGSDAKGIPEISPQTVSTTMNLFPVPSKLDEVFGGSTGNTGLMMSQNLTSMDLYPQKSGFVRKMVDSSVNRLEPETAQMTIFYNGQVVVFNDCPAYKAKEIMLLASNGSSYNLGTYVSTTPVQKSLEPTKLIPTNSSVVSRIGNMVQEHIQLSPPPMATDLPKIARKASLARFLEKRKDRMTAQAPYSTSNSRAFPSKLVESKSWLGLTAQSPVQFEGQM